MISTRGEIKWTARLDHVVEVSLFGAADLDYWTDKLAAANLRPIERDGKARVLIITGDARFRGVRFKEISFSVLARRTDDPAGAEGAYLAQAWNSSRFFAWCERVLFSTPYAWGDVNLSAADPVSIHLADHGRTLFRAELRSVDGAVRGPISRFPGGWSGPIFLRSRRASGKPKQYFARLEGLTETYPFLPDTDCLTINASAGAWALASLLESRFTPEHWEIRRDATHARSKTETRRPD